MGGLQRATKVIKMSALKNSLSRVVNAVSNDDARMLVEKNGVPVAIVSVSDLRRLVHGDRTNRGQEEDPFAGIERAGAAFKDVPIEEIERETDRAIAEIRARDRAAREALVAAG